MRLLISFLAGVILSASLDGWAQSLDIRLRGTIDTLSFSGDTFFTSDGGTTTTVTCSSRSADTADGGAWTLLVDSAGPVTRPMPNGAISECRRVSTISNKMDGG
jgi:hypothetical protein